MSSIFLPLLHFILPLSAHILHMQKHNLGEKGSGETLPSSLTYDKDILEEHQKFISALDRGTAWGCSHCLLQTEAIVRDCKYQNKLCRKVQLRGRRSCKLRLRVEVCTLCAQNYTTLTEWKETQYF